MKVGIVGLGLMGGSLARDLSAAGHFVLGADTSKAAVRGALRARAITGDLGRRQERLAECDVVVLATPVDAAVEALASVAPLFGNAVLVTDVGSTKLSIVRAAERLGLGARFVGSHPLAGDHASGWRASREGMFTGQQVYLTPSASIGTPALRAAKALWTGCGAKSLVVDPAEHDRLLSATSHVPQVTALALATLLADAEIPRAALGRGGRDMTRLAASSPDVWSAILADNRTHVAAGIRRMRQVLSAIEAKVAKGDRASLRRLVSHANAWSRGK